MKENFSTNKISSTLKILTAICALGGVLISLITATHDGYSHWSKRLLYFTGQSNVWIGITMVAILISNRLPIANERARRMLYLLKHAFTVCITVTFIVFFCFLAPFADKSYHVWSVSSFLTHAFSPTFAIADFFIDDYFFPLNTKQCLFAIIPPLFYVLICAVLSIFNVDFGRGVNYPYFFMDHFSSAGLFGFSKNAPLFGSFYWITLLALITITIAFFYAKSKTASIKKNSTAKSFSKKVR